MIDRIEFDETKTDQAMDINKALQRLKEEKKKGVEESTKMAPIPEDPLEKDD